MGHKDIPQSPWTFSKRKHQESLEDSPRPLACRLPQGRPAHCTGSSGPPASPLQGTVLCDIILLNFLKGADHYKAKKFEEVSRGPRDVGGQGRKGPGPWGLSVVRFLGASEGKFTGPQCKLGDQTRGGLAKSGLCEDRGGSVGCGCPLPHRRPSWGGTNPAMAGSRSWCPGGAWTGPWDDTDLL